MILALLSTALLAASPATPNTAAAAEFKAACEAFQAENGGKSDCACLAGKVAADPALAEAMGKVTSPADLETAPEAVHAAIKACTPAETAGN